MRLAAEPSARKSANQLAAALRTYGLLSNEQGVAAVVGLAKL
jgi:hypothetical protein